MLSYTCLVVYFLVSFTTIIVSLHFFLILLILSTGLLNLCEARHAYTQKNNTYISIINNTKRIDAQVVMFFFNKSIVEMSANQHYWFRTTSNETHNYFTDNLKSLKKNAKFSRIKFNPVCSRTVELTYVK